jgi:hypothetical protein
VDLQGPLGEELAAMKAEERHELRENDLANWLHYGLWAFLKQNGSYILLVLALGFLGFQLWNMYQRKQETKRQEAWVALIDANRTNDPFKSLQEIIDTGTIKPVQAQACLQMGQNYGRLVISPEQLIDRKMTREQALSNAFDYYQKALEFQGNDPVIFVHSHLGIAGVYEDRENWDQARTEYKSIIDNKMFTGAQASLATLAKDRLDSLEDRRKAPRLATMIPPPAAARPDVLPGMSGLGSGLGGLGGLSGLGGGAVAPTPATSTAFPDLLQPPTRSGTTNSPTTSPIFGPIGPIGPAPTAPSPSPSSGAPATAPK